MFPPGTDGVYAVVMRAFGLLLSRRDETSF